MFKKSAHISASFEVEDQPEGQLTCVVGDIHGCADPLIALIKKLGALEKEIQPKRFKLVFLGDLIDRGPDSKLVIETLMNLRSIGIDATFLLGNHEEVFLEIMGGRFEKIRSWFEYGGLETARSYGVGDLGNAYVNPQKTFERLKECVPAAHIDFIAECKDGYIFDHYACVHAGIRPKTSLIKQSAQDLRWIREPFLSSKLDHKYMIIHGHTIVEAPEVRENRIAIDTGSYETGVITAAYFYQSKMGFVRSDDLPVSFTQGKGY